MRFSTSTKLLLTLAVLAGMILLLDHFSHCGESASDCALCSAVVLALAVLLVGFVVCFVQLGRLLVARSDLPLSLTHQFPTVRGPPMV